jgi:hypothetical protein
MCDSAQTVVAASAMLMSGADGLLLIAHHL